MDSSMIFNEQKFMEAFRESFPQSPIFDVVYNKNSIKYKLLDSNYRCDTKTSEVLRFKQDKLSIHKLIFKDLTK